MAFTIDKRRDIGEAGVKSMEFLPFGALNVPAEGVSQIFYDEKTGDSYGKADPRENPEAPVLENMKKEQKPDPNAPTMDKPKGFKATP